jgi:hypothetical protein
MPTPAGSMALADSYPADGAPVIQQSPDPLRGLPKPTGFAAERLYRLGADRLCGSAEIRYFVSPLMTASSIGRIYTSMSIVLVA